MEKQNFFQKYQVLLSAIAGAVALVLQQFIDEPELNYKVLGLAVLMAVAGVIGNEYRGKGVSVAGLLGVAALAFTQIQSTGTFTWPQFILAIVVGFLAMVAPPPKNAAYEKTPLIMEAKKEAKVIVATEKAEEKTNGKPIT